MFRKSEKFQHTQKQRTRELPRRHQHMARLCPRPATCRAPGRVHSKTRTSAYLRVRSRQSASLKQGSPYNTSTTQSITRGHSELTVLPYQPQCGAAPQVDSSLDSHDPRQIPPVPDISAGTWPHSTRGCKSACVFNHGSGIQLGPGDTQRGHVGFSADPVPQMPRSPVLQ